MRHIQQVFLSLPHIDLEVGGHGDEALQLCLLPMNCLLEGSQVIPLGPHCCKLHSEQLSKLGRHAILDACRHKLSHGEDGQNL